MHDLPLVGTAMEVDQVYGTICQLTPHLSESHLIALGKYVEYRLSEIERVRQITDVMDPDHIDHWWGAVTPVEDLVTDRAKVYLHGIYHPEWNPKQMVNKIAAIKALREEHSYGLRESKILCDAYLHLHEQGTILFPMHLLHLDVVIRPLKED